jgi:hypothetical protein
LTIITSRAARRVSKKFKICKTARWIRRRAFCFFAILKKKLKKSEKKSLFSFSSRCQAAPLFVVSKHR